MSYMICVVWFTVRGICLPRYIFNGDSHIVPSTHCSRREKGRGRVGDSVWEGVGVWGVSLRVSCQHNIRFFFLGFKSVSRRYSDRLGYLAIYPVAYYLFIYLFARLFTTFTCNTFPGRKVFIYYFLKVCRKAKFRVVGKGVSKRDCAACTFYKRFGPFLVEQQ